ncbi:hypothetical protein TBLA_0I03020 [Henningerozyma blattae CBS 6284]|uniref:Uncharacterized protein n=1 Tax=Henningerozyma blattae (strain ATCC 34711 / CBS 6284 / DSM 70876 / NBRC 10599 / NRRL Y-10934 / UCD 77-7) TaxID=1071380 RepID=I2H9A6_HENB6|nr:hypothetical protein TBLA_0I03020 [Tetrapisispora blattae CBS 6284]CCH62958.1 hypothetical protein TBLA_0I03020 [Tetrapisispora blattae CBS 6284]
MSSKDPNTSINHVDLKTIQQRLDELRLELRKKKQCHKLGTTVTLPSSSSSNSISSTPSQKTLWKTKDSKLQKEILQLESEIIELEKYLKEEGDESLLLQSKTVGKEIDEEAKITVANEITDKSKATVAREIDEDSKLTVANEIRDHIHTTVGDEVRGRSNFAVSNGSRVKSSYNRRPKTVAEEISG